MFAGQETWECRAAADGRQSTAVIEQHPTPEVAITRLAVVRRASSPDLPIPIEPAIRRLVARVSTKSGTPAK